VDDASHATPADVTAARMALRRLGGQAHRQRLDAARRLGQSPRDRLRWILRFVGTPLDGLTPATLDAIGAGLWQFAIAGATPPGAAGGAVSGPARLTGPMIYAIQGELRGQLRSLSETPRAQWTPPPGPPLVIEQFAPVDSGRLRFRIARRQFDDVRTAIPILTAELLVSCADCVRRCPECGEPFVPVSRQIFCAEACQQRDFDRRRPDEARVSKPPAFKLRERGK
jgi:hypothetical protein